MSVQCHIDAMKHETTAVDIYYQLSTLTDSHIVVIPAGVPRKKLKFSRDDLFKDNANLVLNIAKSVAQNSPKAIVVIITNPVNSLVPLTYEVLKKVRFNNINNRKRARLRVKL